MNAHGPNRVDAALSKNSLFSYAVFGLPLAFVALPIYVHVPKLYADEFGVSLWAVGGSLLIARIGDAVIDPAIGLLGDRWGRRKWAIALALPLLALGVLGLLDPPQARPGVGWMLAMLVVVYFGYSFASVNYQAWGAELGASAHERTQIVASREGCALLGVVLASVLPGFLADSESAGLARLAWVFVALLFLSAVITLWLAPSALAPTTQRGAWLRLFVVMEDAALRRLFVVFAISGIAAALPASLVLFFIADVLLAEGNSGLFLAAYFVSGAASLPLWVWVSHRIGKLRAWAASMVLAVMVFGWAASLAAGDGLAFALICALSGAALGADLALPPAMLADLVLRRQGGTGIAFGWWSLVSKLNLALAAGIALPSLSLLGYTPGTADPGALEALAWAYAGLPACLKLLAAIVLWKSRLLLETEISTKRI